MVTIVLDINNDKEEELMISFLNEHNYNYSISRQPEDLSDSQKDELLRREHDFESGEIQAEPWQEIKKLFRL